ncbi:MAG: hypothetical protein OEZ06_02870 [Myxococcales bacterium]|nr:hypothetical protein [Myxococcales bacterium]
MMAMTLSEEAAPIAPLATKAKEVPAPPASTWASDWLQTHDDESLTRSALRALTGLGLASAFGIAMGPWSDVSTIAGQLTALWKARGSIVPMALPALYILLALLDAPLTASQLLRRATRALFGTGLLLSGFAPVVALYAMTATPGASAVVSFLSLYLCGGIALMRLCAHCARDLRAAGAVVSGRLGLALGGFMLLSWALALLPMGEGFITHTMTAGAP